MEHGDTTLAVLGVLILAWIGDQMTGRRGYFAASLVAGVGAVCGWFLSIRVFAHSTMDDWLWVGWALAGSVLALAAYTLFRSKR